MITAVDSSVLLDIYKPDPRFGAASGTALRRCLAEGALVACEAVWAEIAGEFSSAREAATAMEGLGLGFDALDQETALDSGAAWWRYRDRGGTRERIVADFLIGAHADRHADRLLTRDRGFYRTSLSPISPLGAPGWLLGASLRGPREPRCGIGDRAAP